MSYSYCHDRSPIPLGYFGQELKVEDYIVFAPTTGGPYRFCHIDKIKTNQDTRIRGRDTEPTTLYEHVVTIRVVQDEYYDWKYVDGKYTKVGPRVRTYRKRIYNYKTALTLTPEIINQWESQGTKHV